MLAFTEYGAGDGTPLLIAHGLYGSGRNWGVIAKRLADTRRVVTVDMRNHGHSPWSDDHGYADLAEDLAEVIDHLGAPMDVVGHSMGGKASMMLALTHPDRVRRLVVGDIAPVSYGHSQMQYIDAMRAVDLSRVTRRSDANAQLAEQGVEPALCSFLTQSLDLAEGRWRFNLDALAANMPAILGFPEVTGAHDGPTLFLSGGQSDYVHRDYRDTIRGLFPAARFAKIPAAGHWLHADDPRAFEGTVRAYLDARGL
ncbi:alpha/beta fold hydrolase [uncultured Tateyamaria sp.]|uniref:alpha/beta fold hydrolase n=1 Tax=uncultured Tateyamaria sp. TaxID=455651 RepID=UPI0026073A1D|nr:alpha/beta fold hydrolase [uncultured Tateyamaria sp.]